MILVSSSWFWVVAIGLLLLGCILAKKWELLKVILLALAVMGIADFISFEIVKQWVKQDRPCWMFHGVTLATGSCGGSYGFTSNHAANGAAFAATLWMFTSIRRRWLSVALFTLPLLVGFSRIYLGVHFPSDVVGGLLLGSTCALISWAVIARFFARKYQWLRTKPDFY